MNFLRKSKKIKLTNVIKPKNQRNSPDFLKKQMSGLLTRQILIRLTSMSGTHLGKVPGLHAQAQKHGGIEDHASSDPERLSSRAYRPRHLSVQEETSGVR